LFHDETNFKPVAEVPRKVGRRRNAAIDDATKKLMKHRHRLFLTVDSVIGIEVM
jgi:hypothetical protein